MKNPRGSDVAAAITLYFQQLIGLYRMGYVMLREFDYE